MAEYIERKKTVELLRSLGNREYRKKKGTIQDAIKMISYPEYTPTADVAPVVRCMDCKHFNHKRMECENEAISTDHEGGAQYSLNFWPDDFCSYGEPKEGTTHD